MSLAIGNVEDAVLVDAGGQAVGTLDTTSRYDRAKAELRRAEARGEGVAEATSEFAAARDALRAVLETIWPGA